MQAPVSRLDHLTFKGNLRESRYGWLRLTPAYSVHAVSALLEENWRPGTAVLDPFCGTGTTALVCAERGIECDTTDINPFLLWLATAKTRSYSRASVEAFRGAAERVARAIAVRNGEPGWVPALHQIEKWWSPATLGALGRAMAAIRRSESIKPPSANLLRVAFCRTMIAHAHVSFGHQSMSFKKAERRANRREEVLSSWRQSVSAIADAAATPIQKRPRAILCDARELGRELEPKRYGCVITSPPYPNRMSYIRELRPYMYWLGHLSDGRQAGELDWQAIGGTWGCATSNVAKWTPTKPVKVPFAGFRKIVDRITAKSPVLGRYVEKYFYDMLHHTESLVAVVAPGGSVHYIVGNSKFYDVLLPVEAIYAAMFEQAGFERVEVKTLRKRTSKKELYEFVVSAKKPGRDR